MGIFGKKSRSDEWHTQIDFTASLSRPSQKTFPYELIRKHTDHYLRKKGKLSQQDIDIRLAILIEGHEARDVAVAACAHAISPTSLRAILNVELSVAPATYFGLEMYLQSLVAAHISNPKSVTELEAQWAIRLLPYATYGSGAAGKYLEGLCQLLSTTAIPNMGVVPDFSILAHRAFRDFASELEGLKLRCQWVTAYNSIVWLPTIQDNAPAVTPPGHLLPEHLLDISFPLWRIWASWKPRFERITFLDGMCRAQRGVLPDLLALEGPDFISGKYATLADGIIARYGEVKPIVRFQGLIFEVLTCERDELKEMLTKLWNTLEAASKGSAPSSFKLFLQFTIARPITQETLAVMESVYKIPHSPQCPINDSVFRIYEARNKLGGMHIYAIADLIVALEHPRGEDLRKVILKPWLIQGIENCIRECQGAVKTHIDTGLAWTHLAMEFHDFCTVVKESKNFLPLLDAGLRAQLDVLPTAEVMDAVVEIYTAAGGEMMIELGPASKLKDSIEAFCADRLLHRQKKFVNSDAHKIMSAMLQVWQATTNADRRDLAILAAKSIGQNDIILRCKGITQTISLPDEFVKDLLSVVDESKVKLEQAIVSFTKLLAGTMYPDVVGTWIFCLLNMIVKTSSTLVDYTLQNFRAYEWLQWMLELTTIFVDIIPNQSNPPILQASLHLWAQQLSEYTPTITRLEEFLLDNKKQGTAIHCILNGGEGLWVESLVKILRALERAREAPEETLMQRVTARLARKGDNASEIAECVHAFASTSPKGLEACYRIDSTTVRQDKKAVALAEVEVAGWVQDEDMMVTDKAAITSLATLLDLKVYVDEVPKETLAKATQYYEEMAAWMLEEAARLEGIQRGMKAVDPVGTAVFLESIGIQDMSPLEEELELLPPDILNAVEMQGRNEVEISFPLTAFTGLQRSAMGSGTANTLLVHLFLDYYDKSFPPAFCTHLDTDGPDDYDNDHSPWVPLTDTKEPDLPICPYGNFKTTALTWQMNRILHRHLRYAPPDIAAIHAFISNRLQDLAHCCIICGTTHNARHTTLRRSVPCSASACTRIWNSMTIPLEVRIPELRTDPFAIDMLLTGVYAAAMSSRVDLLPKCPITSTISVTQILNSLPPLSTLQTSQTLSTDLEDQQKELLIWACTHYRGFISSASGILRIPSLPVGTHQFVLANASPILEAGFVGRVKGAGSAGTRILFHGTSLDRLPGILKEGLKVCSGTTLQRTGAAHGKGIYMAEEPATSFSYSPAAVSWANSGLNNMRLILGCEVIGNGNIVTPGIHVIKEEGSVMVRYVFLFAAGARVPIAGHLTPAMLSACSALRSGSV